MLFYSEFALKGSTNLPFGPVLLSGPSCDRTKWGPLALSASNTSMLASSAGTDFGPGLCRGVRLRDFRGTSVLSLYELVLMMLKLERESSIHMLLLCSESRDVSSWHDILLSSSRSSGGGEMFNTVRRFDGVIWWCGCVSWDTAPLPAIISPPDLQLAPPPPLPFPPSAVRTSGTALLPLPSSGSTLLPWTWSLEWATELEEVEKALREPSMGMASTVQIITR